MDKFWKIWCWLGILVYSLGVIVPMINVTIGYWVDVAALIIGAGMVVALCVRMMPEPETKRTW